MLPPARAAGQPSFRIVAAGPGPKSKRARHLKDWRGGGALCGFSRLAVALEFRLELGNFPAEVLGRQEAATIRRARQGVVDPGTQQDLEQFPGGRLEAGMQGARDGQPSTILLSQG